MSCFNSFYDDLDTLYDNTNKKEEDEIPIDVEHITKAKHKKKKKVDTKLSETDMLESTDWDALIKGLKHSKSRFFDDADEDGDIFTGDVPDGNKRDGKKKGTKKKKVTDYDTMLKKEMVLLDDIYKRQDNFVSSLELIFTNLTKSKGVTRGINKALTDLISTINQGHSTTASIIKQQADLKKSICELKFKERAQLLREGTDSTEQDSSRLASDYLNRLIAHGRKDINSMNGSMPSEEFDVSEYEVSQNDTEDVIYNLLDETSDPTRNAYFKYINTPIEIYVKVDESDPERHEFIAINESDMTICDDYPLPDPSLTLLFNTTNNTATDIYGRKYKVLTDELDGNNKNANEF